MPGERSSAGRRSPNLLVLQTMSKSQALTGLRVGYLRTPSGRKPTPTG
jgi:histidinol-phosphate/aromatic aminotransferase/cobyric acid decarboxylase-like protein